MLKEKNEASEAQGLTRRKVLKAVCCAGAVAAVSAAALDKAGAALSGRVYPHVKIANIKNLPAGKAIKFDYPLSGRKNILVNLGCAVDGGAGADRSIVAYSMFCTHLGCAVELDHESGMLVCECHQSIYDAKQSGRVIEGPAPASLPVISLEIDNNGDIYAAGVAGLIYGLRNNLLDGEEVKQ